MSNFRSRTHSVAQDLSTTAVVSDPDWANALSRRSPELSAAQPMVRWQRWAFALAALALTSGLIAAPDPAAAVVMALLTPAFLGIALLRMAALTIGSQTPRSPSIDAPFSEADAYPVYSILVPLYREAHMVQPLIRALEQLEWPATRRDILFITEQDDADTRSALERETRGRMGMRIVSVPPGTPRTKPRALMYALPYALGDFVVVYDAEDEPEPGQLREAFRRFGEAGPEIGCLQAKLNIYNPRQNVLTRQFTLEYTALFDAILPALQRLRLPVPLGGTSNHFRRDVLEKSGGWDPYNVTEDADLGLRLARMGWRIEVLNSTTWEEAPPSVRTWLGQRARWLKGWVQTSLVHLRRPRRLLAELGPRGFIGFNIVMCGIILSALLHPLVYAYALWKYAAGDLMLWPPEGWQAVVWWAGAAHLALAYSVGIGLAAVMAWKRHGPRLAAHAILMPFYWMLISAAAYSAILDFIRTPFHWRKTDHTVRSRASVPPT